jgi:predicted nucleic acid-binding protein
MTTPNAERIFIDTNVLVYLISEDVRKADIAAAILEAAPAISVQVLNEFISVARRKHKKSWFDVLDIVDAAKEICEVVPLTQDMQERAVEFAMTSQIDIYDANIVAAAELSGCDVLYTEDLNDGQRVGRVMIRNPFVAG